MRWNRDRGREDGLRRREVGDGEMIPMKGRTHGSGSDRGLQSRAKKPRITREGLDTVDEKAATINASETRATNVGFPTRMK
jgi:hypothetical protein